MRVALLARVSTEGQAAEDRHSLPAQLDAMRRRCEREGWEVVREYRAAGESAFTSSLAKRPVLAAAVADAEAGEFELLMVHENSRFARNRRLFHEVTERLERAGVRWLEADEQLAPMTADLRLVRSFKGDLAAYWSEKMSEHIRKALVRRVELGLANGDVPFGYRSEGAERPWVVVPGEAGAVRETFEARASGVGYEELARRLNAGGFVPHSKQGNRSFSGSAVQSLLETEYYAGFVGRGPQRRRGAHEPIVSEALFGAAADMVSRQRSPRARVPRLLSGLAECVECGAPMVISQSGRATSPADYYRESRRGTCERGGRRMRADLVEAKVAGLVKGMFADEGWVASLDRRSRVVEAGATEQAARVVGERRRAQELYVAGELTRAEYREMVEAIEARGRELRAVEPSEVLFAGKRLQSWAEVWDVLPLEHRRQALEVMWRRAYVSVGEQEVYFTPTETFEPLFRAKRRWMRDGHGGVPGTPGRSGGLVVPGRLYSVSEFVA